MMAKMFYTMEEAKTALGRNEEEIKDFAREGRLREFRDGARLMFKADQVEQLKAEMGAGVESGPVDNVDLGVSDSGGLIGLVDTTGASGTSITLSDVDTGQSSGAGMTLKEDTALAADLGLSGTMGGVPSPRGGGAGSGTGLSGMGSGGAGRSGAGINVFGADEVIERVDPSAQTAISGGIRDQIDLQGVGSGSGLLDLTRESDDTSLGAVLDEITPSGTLAQAAQRRGPAPMGMGTGTGMGMGSGTGMGMGMGSGTGMGFEMPGEQQQAYGTGYGSPGFEEMGAPAPARVQPQVVEKVYIQARDPLAPAFGGAALAGAAVILFGVFVLITSMLGTRPQAVTWFIEKKVDFIKSVGMGLGAVVLLFGVGLIVGLVTAKK